MILCFTGAGFSAPLKPLQERAFVAFFYVFLLCYCLLQENIKSHIYLLNNYISSYLLMRRGEWCDDN